MYSKRFQSTHSPWLEACDHAAERAEETGVTHFVFETERDTVYVCDHRPTKCAYSFFAPDGDAAYMPVWELTLQKA